MHTTIDRNSKLIDVVANFRGPVVDARIAYPEVLHLEVRDVEGKLWRLATQDASWSPSDPAELRGRTIVKSSVDAKTGELSCQLANGGVFAVTPAEQLAADDPPNWELFTPDGLLLDFGPGRRWRIGDPRELDAAD